MQHSIRDGLPAKFLREASRESVNANAGPGVIRKRRASRCGHCPMAAKLPVFLVISSVGAPFGSATQPLLLLHDPRVPWPASVAGA